MAEVATRAAGLEEGGGGDVGPATAAVRKADHSRSALQGFKRRSLAFRLITLPVAIVGVLVCVIAITAVVVPWLLWPSKSGEERVRSRASKTAQATALGRFHNFICGIGEDRFAGHFLPLPHKFAMRILSISWVLARHIFDGQSGIVGMMFQRTNFIDACIRYAVQDCGVQNVVFCGAGFDTRAFRMKKDLEGVNLFEVDTEATQVVKRACLKRAGMVPPSNLTFCQINFNDQDVFDVLREHGFDGSKKTLMVWEGVAMYLAPEVVESFLETNAANLTADSMLVMDWLWDTSRASKPAEWMRKFNGHKLASKAAASRGEPFSSGLPEPFLEVSTARDFFSARNWQLEDLIICGAPETSARYLTLDDGHVFGRAYEANNFFLLKPAPQAQA